MSKVSGFSALLGLLACVLPLCAGAQNADDGNDRAEASANSALPAPPWPLRIDSDGDTLLVYRPEFENWQGDRLEGRAAVALTRAGAKEPQFGIVWLTARTQIDTASGTVAIRGLEPGKSEFPTASGGAADLVAVLRRHLAAVSWQMPLERLRADLDIDTAVRRAAAQPLKNDAPKIMFSDRPAILVPIDGAPSLRGTPGSGLQRIVNTRALMLFDPATARYYLYVGDHWMQARSVEGAWEGVPNPPAALDTALQAAVESDEVDLLNADDERGAVPRNAVIFVSTEPAELLQTDGAAEYAPVEGTRLLQVANSPNRIFFDVGTQTHYALISGRWFRARSLSAENWEYVAATSLPEEFARIPSSHPAQSVLASVAGTPQAREAAIANSVPQVATVSRSTEGPVIAYDGEPRFEPIAGTALQRAVNTATPVIRADDGVFYSLLNAVWFTASTPFGPWSVAASVPAQIYAIPRDSPLHYVTYVRVYDATPEVVYTGYTPGYVGSYVSSDNVVVYGTGWYYRPWIGSVWYASPLTWGFGFAFVQTWWHPWHACCVAAWVPAPYVRPWWGPWHHHPAAPVGWRPEHRDDDWHGHREHARAPGMANIYHRWGPSSHAWTPRGEPPPRHAGAAGWPTRGAGRDERPEALRRNFDRGTVRDWRSGERAMPGRTEQGPRAVRNPGGRGNDDAGAQDFNRAARPAGLPQIQRPLSQFDRRRDGGDLQQGNPGRRAWQSTPGNRPPLPAGAASPMSRYDGALARPFPRTGPANTVPAERAGQERPQVRVPVPGRQPDMPAQWPAARDARGGMSPHAPMGALPPGVRPAMPRGAPVQMPAPAVARGRGEGPVGGNVSRPAQQSGAPRNEGNGRGHSGFGGFRPDARGGDWRH